MSYPLLTETMSQHTSLQMLRHFSHLNIKSLLYYQAELEQLSRDLADVEKQDAESGNGLRETYQKCAWRLRECENLSTLPIGNSGGTAEQRRQAQEPAGEAGEAGEGNENASVRRNSPDAREQHEDEDGIVMMNLNSRQSNDSTRCRHEERNNDPEEATADLGSENGETESVLQRKNEWLAQRQWKLISRIRVVLDEYCTFYSMQSVPHCHLCSF